MTTENIHKFHISYTLDPQTQDIKLTFSQGDKKCVIDWYDKENSWEDVIAFCSRTEKVWEECGHDFLNINPISRTVQIFMFGYGTEEGFQGGHVYIVDRDNAQDAIEGMEWVKRYKIYGVFKIEPLDLIKELYSVMMRLYNEPQYNGIHTDFLESLYHLSRDIDEKEKKRKKPTKK